MVPETPKLTLRGKQGFSLLELTAALSLLTLGVSGTIQMYFFSVAKTQAIQEGTIAFRAATNEVEALRGQPFSELEPVAERPFVTNTPELVTLHQAHSTVQILDRSSEGVALREIAARVTWVGEHGRRIEKRVTTLMTDLD